LLLADNVLRERVGQAAGRRVREHFTAERTALGLFDMYEHLLAEPAPEAGSYSVDLLLQAAAEYGYLGERLTALEERMKKAEHAADLILDNSFARLLRKMLGRKAAE
jgi:hypothetical protein